MSGLHLRQVCLAAPALEPATADLMEIFGLEACVRDFHVDIYGLTNVLLPIGADFIEIVAPMQPDTAAGRFIEKSAGRGGYMAIFQCDDIEHRRRHVGSLGIRTPHVIDTADYRNVQLHPKDCRATIVEFASSGSGEDRRGKWWPAGPSWPHAARVGSGGASLAAIEVASPDPFALASHWANIAELTVSGENGAPALFLDDSKVLFVVGESERLDALVVSVDDPAKVLRAAERAGRRVRGDRFELAGVDFRVVTA